MKCLVTLKECVQNPGRPLLPPRSPLLPLTGPNSDRQSRYNGDDDQSERYETIRMQQEGSPQHVFASDDPTMQMFLCFLPTSLKCFAISDSAVTTLLSSECVTDFR